jgi:hypothetical protein
MYMPDTKIRFAVAAATGLFGLAGCGGGNDSSHASFTPFEVNFAVVAVDVNGDGRKDVVSGRTLHQPTAPGESGALYTSLHNAGAGTGFAAASHVMAGIEPLFLAAADLNGDGLPDIVSASFDDAAVQVFLNSTTTPGQWATPQVLPSPGASQLVIADLNGDGKPDIVSADYFVDLFLQDPASAGHFLAPVPLSSGGANWVAVGDLNHDGLPDIVIVDATGVHVQLHGATATSASFGVPTTVFTQTPNIAFLGANIVAIADIDGDGYNDLVITDPGAYGPTPPTVNVLRQNPAAPGTFLPAVSFPIAQGSLAQSLQVADLNGDGHPDIVVGDRYGVSVLLQSATTAGSFAAATTYAAPLGAFQVAVADVNDDGLPDLVVANSTTLTSSGGVLTTQPGVLLQDPANHGSFKPLQNLP